LLLLGEDGSETTLHTELEPTSAAICVCNDQAILVSEYGRETRVPLKSHGDPECTLPVHRSAGVAVTAADGQVISSGAGGSVALTAPDANGAPAIVASIERQLRCDGALIEAMKGEREFALLAASGAHRQTPPTSAAQ
jgi:hypothetical protein